MANQIATLLQNSTLLRSYETLMQQYEDQLTKKTKLVDQLERDYQQSMAENNTMCDQIYKLRQDKFSKGQTATEADQNESSQVVELLRRNHDTMLEKYELYRQRNEVLEKSYLDKEHLYLKIKGENEQLSDQVYGYKRVAEDCKQENTLLKTKLINAEQTSKTNGEQAVSFKISKEKFENSHKTIQEQLELVTKSHDELVVKK